MIFNSFFHICYSVFLFADHFITYSATMRGVNLSKVSVTVIMPHCDFIAPCKMRDPAAQKVCLVDSTLPKPKNPNIFEKDAILHDFSV